MQKQTVEVKQENMYITTISHEKASSKLLMKLILEVGDTSLTEKIINANERNIVEEKISLLSFVNKTDLKKSTK